jgi:Zn-finger nucleic acid-binding protein
MSAAPPALLCGKCNIALSPGPVTVAYMGKSFDVELLRCPSCQAAFIPEELALGKMLQVEQALEEK